jgi:hypothetical protein
VALNNDKSQILDSAGNRLRLKLASVDGCGIGSRRCVCGACRPGGCHSSYEAPSLANPSCGRTADSYDLLDALEHPKGGNYGFA